MPYPWGSTDGISHVTGTANPTGEPMAEMWMGAHPKGSSTVLTEDGEIPLNEFINNNSAKILGDYYVWEYGQTLPYLFKILSAAQPLSIQVHPTLPMAIEGYAKEEEKNIDVLAPNRNYKDPNHKPEMMLALTTFYGLCGFRPMEEIQADLSELDLENNKEIKALHTALLSGGYKGLVQQLLSFDDKQSADLISSVVASCQKKSDELFKWVLKVHNFFPNDTGLLYPLILNLVQLEPGEALFLQPGILHAYLEGTGLELMANSDNVLRCALTSKHIDPPELIKNTIFESYLPRPLPFDQEGPVTSFKSPSKEFQLSKVDINSEWEMTKISGPVICLVTEGELDFSNNKKTIHLNKGETLLLAPFDGPVSITGQGVFYRAAIQH